MKIQFIQDLIDTIRGKRLISKNMLDARPEVKYIEIHLCDHCNLNCKGCGHFCPIIEKEVFTDLEQYKKDIEELSQKIYFKEIRLMGGEPLLHPQVNEFIMATRKAYPASEVRIVTNSILLPAMKDDFWDTLKNCGVIVDLSKYPAVGNKFSEYLDLLDDHRIPLGRIQLSKRFFTTINFMGTSNVKETYEKCHSKHCTTLWRSKLYPCPICYREYANKYFDVKITDYDGMDIYKMNGEQLASRLGKPIEDCRFCETVNLKFYPWEQSKKEMSEWGAVSEVVEIDK